MSDRLDFYFRQRVTEAELDLAFEWLEQADRHLAADIGIHGVIAGAVPAPHSPVPDLTVELTAPAKAYDRLGQRSFFGTGQTVDCGVDHTGIPTDVPDADQERWLAIFLRFDRLLSEPRNDGNSQQIFFRRDESFELLVRQAPPGPQGAAPKVPLEPDELLLCDVRRRPGQTQILEPDIDVSRRQAFVFARAEAVEIASSLWNILSPAVPTVQAALDEVDAELTDHFEGTARRHPASHIDYVPHGFVASDTVQAAIDEVVDDLSSAEDGNAGATRIGADAVPGTPHALPATNVDTQLSQLLTWLNEHLAQAAGAHHASAIAAAPHHYLDSTSVQAQLQELASDLASQTAESAGASRIGAAAVSGTPHDLPAGSLAAQLSQLLAALNTHSNAADNAHPATAISIADPGDKLAANHVEAALTEVADAFDDDHYRANEPHAGQHRAIHQPVLADTGRVLLWDAQGVGAPQARLRVYADSDSIWFTLNAAWNGAAWVRDESEYHAAGFRFSRFEFEFLQQDALDAPFVTWSRIWRLPMNGESNSALSTVGTIREQGRLGMEGTNTHSAARTMALGGAVTFRSRFPATPSSITLAPNITSNGWQGTPTVYFPDRDGFGFYAYQNAAAGSTIWWFGKYDAIA